jgi:hypothetical protein
MLLTKVSWLFLSFFANHHIPENGDDKKEWNTALEYGDCCVGIPVSFNPDLNTTLFIFGTVKGEICGFMFVLVFPGDELFIDPQASLHQAIR